MHFLGYKFIFQNTEDYRKDLLIDELAQIGFSSFEETEAGFNAFIIAEELDSASFKELCDNYDKNWLTQIEEIPIEHKNWNEEWEKNFSPIVISNQCLVRATFHPADNEFPYQIIIDPKMSFGTGHHQTTSAMMELMLNLDFKEKNVLDMGCGTGILAIFAHLLGAKSITAIDYDDVCVESTHENMKINQIVNYQAIKGSKEVIPEMTYDIILANINRNILLDQIEVYNTHLQHTGLLLLSGFYHKNDSEIITQHCNNYGLTKLTDITKEDWTAIVYNKK